MMVGDANPSGFDRPCPAWFVTPQMGIFIHWGLYSVPAWAPRGRALDQLLREDYDNLATQQPYAEWYGNAMRLPDSATAAHHRSRWQDMPYSGFRPMFDAASKAFDAASWIDLFVSAGAAYIVLVAKHHDGYCLWPTDVANPHRPGWHSTRDFVGELATEARARGLRFGLYYSGGLDWTFRHTPVRNLGDMLACIPTGDDYRAYAAAQVRELVDRYRPSVLWNDIGWPNDSDVPALLSYYYDRVPDGVVNDRWGGDPALLQRLQSADGRAQFNTMMKAAIRAGKGIMGPPKHADFRTVEYGLGTPDHNEKWEACRGVGLSFGYNRGEVAGDHIDATALAEMRNAVFKGGGNLLINVGPMADGTISVLQRAALAAVTV